MDALHFLERRSAGVLIIPCVRQALALGDNRHCEGLADAGAGVCRLRNDLNRRRRDHRDRRRIRSQRIAAGIRHHAAVLPAAERRFQLE